MSSVQSLIFFQARQHLSQCRGRRDDPSCFNVETIPIYLFHGPQMILHSSQRSLVIPTSSVLRGIVLSVRMLEDYDLIGHLSDRHARIYVYVQPPPRSWINNQQPVPA